MQPADTSDFGGISTEGLGWEETKEKEEERKRKCLERKKKDVKKWK